MHQNLLNWITDLMQSLGYVGIAFLMFLDNIFPPIPSELIMPTAGFISSQGKLNLVLVIIAGSFGSILAACVLYALGHYLNEQRIIKWLEKYGKWLFIKPDDVLKAKQSFNQHGKKIVFFGRMVPALRSIISIPAGMAGMPFSQFLLYSSLGTIIWTSLLACGGFYLGENYEILGKWISKASGVITVVLILLIAGGLYFYFKKKKQNLA